jgi:hypothetical protein
MSDQNRPHASSIATRGRDSAILVISRLWPGEDFTSIEARFDHCSTRVQTEVTVSVLGFLLLLALFAGQFGPLGVMAYLAAVLITVK